MDRPDTNSGRRNGTSAMPPNDQYIDGRSRYCVPQRGLDGEQWEEDFYQACSEMTGTAFTNGEEGNEGDADGTGGNDGF